MENFEALLHGFTIAISVNHIALMIGGVLLGILVGVLPGLGAPNGVSLLLPLTFGMAPVSAIILLSSIYWGALFGGSVTSILFNIPGEPSSVATTFDGYPMARDGRATEALATAFGSAAFGALVGVVLITCLASWIAGVALQFGPAEYFAVYFLAFSSFIGVGGAPPMKTVVSLAIGFAIAAIGMDTVSGSVRLTMGVDELVKGINFVVAVMGLFGIGELLIAVEEELNAKPVSSRIEWGVLFKTLLGLPKHWVALLRSAAIGCWMGITPGGPTAASFMSYGIAKRVSPRRANFGKGEAEGIVSPEAADHAAGTSALLPMLSLGIPGSATAAVMMGGLMIWGLNPGPALFVEQKDFVWGLIASMYLGNIVAVILVLLTVPIFAALMRLFGVELLSRRHADDGLWHPRLSLQEDRLPAGAAGAGHRDRRQGRGRLPPVHADVPGLARHLRRQQARDDLGGGGVCASAFAAGVPDDRHLATAVSRRRVKSLSS